MHRETEKLQPAHTDVVGLATTSLTTNKQKLHREVLAIQFLFTIHHTHVLQMM